MTAAISTIRAYLQAYYDDVFEREYFISIIAMMAVIISINYCFEFPPHPNRWLSFLSDYVLYMVPFAFAYGLRWFYFPADRSEFKNPGFVLMLFVAPALFALRVNFNFHQSLVSSLASPEQVRFVSSVINYVVKGIVLVIPVVVIWYLKDRKYFRLYGFTIHRHRKLYLLLMLGMIPLVLAAAMLPDFLNSYPKAIRDAGLYSSDDLSRFLLFELAYGLDFFSIEFFFRGFLIIAFIKYFGMRAIVPAACFYCCIHLGKPMPEAISSFFGGLLLGIISYHTLSIWGGLLIHLGIAWLMEVAAYAGRHI